MWSRTTLILPIAIAASVIQAQSAERLPFHVSHFQDDVTVNLTATSLQSSPVQDYDFDVTIGLTEFDSAGSIRYTDHGNHEVRVKCDGAGKVFVGGAVYVPTRGVAGSDWKEDLWKSVCMSPVS
ncbi:hypothetical protein FS764_23590 [Agrobacterium vitis]|uniref:hypothetical protein n=1 Tax=Agrobacterium rubi TaxID=28099 RepID=UPI00201B4EA8|nr:hypothetical protein [Agrobacterium rubi]MCF1469859.1 hypothetical protein [Agrobacterium vitis]